ncbi:MAG: ATP/GTP-binding protein [Cyanobacteria bacterium P01_A01_bin.84]
MEVLRILITGSVGAGKTTMIRTISDLEVVETEKKATDKTASLKETTTVALDFGRLIFAPNQALHLYGTPGQARFDFMWDILFRRTEAVILLVDAHRPEFLPYSVKILEFVKSIKQVPMLIGVTHTDFPEAISLDEIVKSLGFTDEFPQPKVIPVNPNEKASVTEALLLLVEELMKTPLEE